MSFEHLLLERDDAIGKIVFNRPDVFNAYNKKLSEEIRIGFNELAEDESVRVIVFTGAGKAFMAGADINMLNEWSAMGNLQDVRKRLGKMFKPTVFSECPKPTIAAVNGLALGMGCELAMACDFRIAADTAKFAQPEIKLGIIPGAGGSQRLLQLVGATKALEMICTGDPINAQEAYRIGLVNRVAPLDQMMEEVKLFAERLMDKSPIALGYCKRLIYEGGELPLKRGLEYEIERLGEIVLTEDAKEGTQAFLEKRTARFKGR